MNVSFAQKLPYTVSSKAPISTDPEMCNFSELVDQRNYGKRPFIDGNRLAINMPIRVVFRKKEHIRV
jgi:hypothetical protein